MDKSFKQQQYLIRLKVRHQFLTQKHRVSSEEQTYIFHKAGGVSPIFLFLQIFRFLNNFEICDSTMRHITIWHIWFKLIARSQQYYFATNWGLNFFLKTGKSLSKQKKQNSSAIQATELNKKYNSFLWKGCH